MPEHTLKRFDEELERLSATISEMGGLTESQFADSLRALRERDTEIAEKVIDRLDAAKVFPQRIVTEVTEASKFYPAEDYHQDYFENNPFQPYCQAAVSPKVAKVRKVFKDLLKE